MSVIFLVPFASDGRLAQLNSVDKKTLGFTQQKYNYRIWTSFNNTLLLEFDETGILRLNEIFAVPKFEATVTAILDCSVLRLRTCLRAGRRILKIALCQPDLAG